MLKKSLISFGSLALAFALSACDEEKKPETPKALGTQTADAPAAPAVEKEPENPVFKAKVRKVIGETDLQRKSTESWKKLRQGQMVYELDRIRTAKESETLLGVNDGSVITVSENSDVTINAEIIGELNKKVAITINNGKVYFDVQKQKNGGTIEFKTGTATAAIRGTAGFVGSVNGQTVASLKEGRLAVTSETNEKAEIVQNQTVIVNKKGKTRSLKLKSSGTQALASALDSIVVASTQGEVVNEKTLQKSLEKFDNSYAKKLAAFEKNSYFLRDKSVPDTVYTPNVTLKAKATKGISVTILGESKVVGDDGVFSFDAEWGASEYGIKRFLVFCSNGEVEYQCSSWSIVYAEPKAEAAPVEPVAEPAKPEPVKAKAKEAPKAEPKPVEQPKVEEPKVEPKKEEPKVEPKKEEPKVETKKEEPKTINLKVSLGGAAKEKIHNPFGSNPRVPGYKGKVYKGNLRVKLSGISNEQLSEIASVQLLKNGDEEGGSVTPSSTSFNIPISMDVNTIADYEVVVTLKNGKSSKSSKKTYEVFCNARAHNPNDLTQYSVSDMNEEKEYEFMAPKLKRE